MVNKIERFKKAVVLVLTFMLVFSFTACSPNTSKSNATATPAVSATAPVQNAFKYTGTVSQEVKQGTLEGVVNEANKTLAWWGVPYAKAPVGELRWKAPQNAEKWNGVLDAKKPRNMSVQFNGKEVLGNEDCLYLNIWRPNTKDENLPVMVFLHGGSNLSGAGSNYDSGDIASRTNAIVVTINYRLGSLGWLNYQPLKTGDKLSDSGNFGLLDAIKSLEWVKENIQSFGGNPKNVTVSGQSAGGRDVLGLLISPLAKDLFQKAISLSGAVTLADTSMGETYAKDLVKKLLVKEGKAANDAEAQAWLDKQSPKDIAAYLYSKDAKDIGAISPNAAIKMEPFPHLFKDGYVIPKEGFDVVKQGKYNQVPIILGSCANEFAMFALQDPSLRFDGAPNLFNLKDESKIQLLMDANNYGSRLYAGSNTDSVADILAGISGQPSVYAYRIAWGMNYDVVKSPLNKYTAGTHGTDLDFLFPTRKPPLQNQYPNDYFTNENKPGREELTNAIMSYFKNFLYKGDPNGDGLVKWGTWQKDIDKERILILDADKNKAMIKMSKEHWVKDEIIKEMNSQLSKERVENLVNKQLKGRFFWEY